MITNNTEMLDASVWTKLYIGIYPNDWHIIIIVECAHIFFHVQRGIDVLSIILKCFLQILFYHILLKKIQIIQQHLL